MLFCDRETLTDSWDIAAYADRVGSGGALIPQARAAEIAAWNARSERLMAAGRGLTMLRTLRAPDAAAEALPKPVSKLFGERGVIAAVRAFNIKYGIQENRRSEYEAAIQAELSSLREALRHGGRYVLGQFTYADIAMAVATMLIKPRADAPMGPAMRRVATDEALADAYADLLAWRDKLYAEHPPHQAAGAAGVVDVHS